MRRQYEDLTTSPMAAAYEGRIAASMAGAEASAGNGEQALAILQ